MPDTEFIPVEVLAITPDGPDRLVAKGRIAKADLLKHWPNAGICPDGVFRMCDITRPDLTVEEAEQTLASLGAEVVHDAT